MFHRSSLSSMWAVGVLLAAACGNEDDSEDSLATSEQQGDGPPSSQSSDNAANRECGDAGSCDVDQLCVATQGALCLPLPPPGEECQQGCVLTEHCCNCTAFSCVRYPGECDDSAGCDCIRSEQREGWLDGCPIDRSECSDSDGAPELICIQVAYDENPFE